MNMDTSFLQKIATAHRGGKLAWLTYENEELKVYRGDSTAVDKLNPDTVIGVYNVKAEQSQIIDDAIHHIELYQREKAAQGRRLAEALGDVHS